MEDTTSPKAILDRLKQGTDSKTDKELAEKLGVGQQAVYNVNAKKKVPDGWVIKIASQYNLSTDWLYFGEGNMYRSEVAEQPQQEELQVQTIGVEGVLTRVGMQAMIERLEKELAVAKENEKAALEEAVKAYKLATEAMSAGSDRIQKSVPSYSNKIEPLKPKKDEDNGNDNVNGQT